MENPNYILKINEAALERRKDSIIVKIFRISVLIIVLLIIFGSIVLQENLFSEFSWETRCLLIVIVVGALFFGKKNDDVPSPLEIQFYDNYLIIYRPRRVYDKRVTRMEINKMFYSDIKKCVVKIKLKRVHIYGRIYATWYNFDKNGCISKTPTYDRIVDDTICFFRVLFEPNIDFRKEIEEHSPLKVTVDNS